MIPPDSCIEMDVAHPQITEAQESKQQSTTLRHQRRDGEQWESTSNLHLLKRELVRRFYMALGEEQRKLLMDQWPNPAIKNVLQEQGIIELKNNTYLIGNVVNNMIHGYALVLYNSNRFYQGHFQNNLKHGMGTQCLSNGTYNGQYVNNKPEGRGVFSWSNGQHYQGDFLAGLKHGQGRWTSKSQSYVGEWKSNKPQGRGVILTDDSRYEGDVRSGLKHGQGRQLFTNGDKYAGGYVNGRPQGIGEYTWAKSVSCYRGTFKNGLRHGNGIWVQSGDRYEGHYLNDRKNGKGKFIWASGNEYTGCYFDDLRHGYGEMKWADGSWYRGQWKYGVQHGMGEMCEKGQIPRRGLFENNTLITEEDDGKKVKMEKIHNRRIDRLAQPQSPRHDKRCHRLLTLPDTQDPNLHKRVPSFSLQRRQKPVQDIHPKKVSTPKHVKHFSERPIHHSQDSKNIRLSNHHDNRLLYKSKHGGEIVRNKSSFDERDDTTQMIQWPTVRQQIDPLHYTTKMHGQV